MVDFGTYSVEDKDQTIVLHVVGASYPNWTGTEIKEQVELRGDQMTWKTAGGGATGAPTTLVWKRMR